MKYVVVGAGAAGLAALRTIRKEDPTAELVCISAEPNPFYFRPMLVELFGRDNFAHELHKPPRMLEKVDWKLGVRVAAVRPKANELELTNGEKISYDFLLLATGTKNDLSHWSHWREHLLTVHSFADMRRLRQRLGDGDVLVLGGGYIAVEVIRQLHNRGHKVQYFTQSESFWPKELPGISSKDVFRLLTGVGVAPQFGVELNDVVDDGTHYTVYDNRGCSSTFESIIAVPVETPDLSYLRGSGINCEEGVVVNEELRTNVPNIFACGDCAQVLDLKREINRLNFGWRSAEKQGELAAQNAIGKSVVYVPTSDDFYFLDLLGKNLFDRWAGNESSTLN